MSLPRAARVTGNCRKHEREHESPQAASHPSWGKNTPAGKVAVLGSEDSSAPHGRASKCLLQQHVSLFESEENKCVHAVRPARPTPGDWIQSMEKCGTPAGPVSEVQMVLENHKITRLMGFVWWRLVTGFIFQYEGFTESIFPVQEEPGTTSLNTVWTFLKISTHV